MFVRPLAVVSALKEIKRCDEKDKIVNKKTNKQMNA